MVRDATIMLSVDVGGPRRQTAASEGSATGAQAIDRTEWGLGSRIPESLSVPPEKGPLGVGYLLAAGSVLA